ncbi:MAG: beta propeller repeat protein [Thermoplasmatota archaeon]
MTPLRAGVVALALLFPALALLPQPAIAQGGGNPFTCTLLGAHGLPDAGEANGLTRATKMGIWVDAGGEYAIDSSGGHSGRLFYSTQGVTWTNVSPINFGGYQVNDLQTVAYADNIGTGSVGRIWVAGNYQQYSQSNGNVPRYYDAIPTASNINSAGGPLSGVNEIPTFAFSHALQTTVDMDVTSFSSSGYAESQDFVGTSGTFGNYHVVNTGNGNDYVNMVSLDPGSEFFGFWNFFNFGSYNTIMQKSVNGASWTSTNTPIPEGFRGLATNGSRIVVVAQSGSTPGYYTDDVGTTWHPVTGLNNDPWVRVVSAGGAWLAIANGGDANRFAYSWNGATWTQFTPPFTDNWLNAAYAPDTNSILVLGATYAVRCQGPEPPAPFLSVQYQNECSIAVLSWSGGAAPYTLQDNFGNTWTNVLTNTTQTQYLLNPLDPTSQIQYRVFGTGFLGPVGPSNTLTISAVNGLAGPCGALYDGSLARTAENILGSDDPAAQTAVQLLFALILISVCAAAFATTFGSMFRQRALAGGAGAFLGFLIAQTLGMIPLWVTFALAVTFGLGFYFWQHRSGAMA